MRKFNIYLVRHGESQANRTGIIQGCRFDGKLSVNGRKQAYKLRLPEVDYYSSPLNRAMETAIIAVGVNINIIDDLREFDFGDISGIKSSELNKEDKKLFARLKNEPNFKAPGGESRAEFITRVKSAFDKIADKKRDAVVFSHAGVIRAILNEHLVIADRQSIDNCEVIKLEYNGTWKIL